MINDINQRMREYLLKLPLLTWILTGFFTTFFFFFFVPVFFDPSQKMKFTQYVPALAPIGHDFRSIVFTSSAWFHNGEFVPIVYPPISRILYLPFTFLSYETGYEILILLILFCYVLITLILPPLINGTKGITALSLLIFITGLVSYGFQFELERGQGNILAIALCLTAIYIFHYHPRGRWLAYIFFTISVQLKLYPAIFIFSLIENWQDWKENIKRFLGLGIVNIGALFIFGLGPVLSMGAAMVYGESNFGRVPYNLSISAFIYRILNLGFFPENKISLWLQSNSWLPQLFLLVFFVICLFIVLKQAYKKNSKGFNPYIFLACTIGTCIIPSLSFDYKLSILPVPVLLFIPVLQSFEQNENKLSTIFLTFLFSTAYSSMLYSYVNKPKILQYNLPALLVLLAICTLWSTVRSEVRGDTTSSPAE